jgi:UDP-N-acetylglucosamine--N-acetylmuramyl-(pentapeptide) pyrophosphoryl-undecaprenol N-acetylglucosamine transferase
VLLATGGTGGHIYPALAVADELAAQGCRVVFVGQQGGLEASLVPASGGTFYGVRAGKWDRGRPDPRQALRAALGLKDALALVRTLRPALVLGFGGFASFPALAAARALGVPYALHEQNAYPGKVTRWFAAGARFVAVAQTEVAAHLPRRAPAPVRVGVPVREQRLSKDEARRRLGLSARGVLTVVMGGSQGSARLNEAVPAAFRALPAALRNDLQVLHSSGPAHLGGTQARAAGMSGYRVDAYLESMLAWSAADLGISRGGNGALAEAAFHGVPLIIVPLPSAAENHQLHNAQAVAAAGAGVVVEERELAALPEVWERLLEPSARRAMAQRAHTRSPEGAARALAALVLRTLYADTPAPNTMQETL